MLFNATLTIVAPFEIKHLFPEKPAQTLGILSATSSVMMIFGPFLGVSKYSRICDREGEIVLEIQ
jgi:hypothetical protein